MKHHVRTNVGESVEFYQHSEVYMKGGKGQGKISSPPNWLFQSSTLFNSLEVQCEALYLTSVDGKYVSKWMVEDYVDDCNAAIANQRTQAVETPETIQEKHAVLLKPR
eukprot:5195148-Ditylum_brightwellii.AAC.1